MYLNNRAAEALAAGRPDEAYGWVRAALQQAPRLVPAWNTLGLVHRRRGDEARAERTWAQALAAEPDNTRVLANLIGLLHAEGRAAEAAPLRTRLARLEPVPPYAWFERGVEALRQGRWAAAREAFAAELARDPDQPEAHAGIAQAEAQLGDMAAARRHLVLARERSATPQQEALYAAKLARLGAAAAPVN
jgi:Tfp pilus assembly protein PilF